MKKGSNRIKGLTAVCLVGFTALIGSLILRDPFSDVSCGEESTELFSEKIESNLAPAIPVYNAGEVTLVPEVETAASLVVSAKAGNEDGGDVEYATSCTENGQTITATALPKAGYKLDHWEVGNEEATSLGDSSEVTISDISEDMELNAVFAKGPAETESVSPEETSVNAIDNAKYKVDVVVDPSVIPTGKQASDIGSVSGGVKSDKPVQVQINAQANTGYKFDHWHVVIDYKQKGKDLTHYIDVDIQSNPYTIYTTCPVSDSDLDYYTCMCYAWFVTTEPRVSVTSVSPYSSSATVKNGSNLVTDSPIRLDKTKPITVTASGGYKIEKVYYITKDGVSHEYVPDPSNLTVVNVPTDIIVEDVYLHVQCSKDAYTVNCIDDPISGGDSEISYIDSGGSTITKKEQLDVPAGTDVTITATPYSGYVFDGFYSQVGTLIPSTTYGSSYIITIHAVSRDQNITAKYIPEKINVTLVPSPAGHLGGGGTVQFESNTPTTTKHTYEFDPTTSGFTIRAVPNKVDGYSFKYWEDSKGSFFNEQNLTISGLKEDRTYTAVFVKADQEHRVSIEPSPADGGTVQYNDEEPVSTRTLYTYDKRSATGFTLKAKANPGYTFQNWTDDKGTNYNTATIRISNIDDDRTYTAVFISDEKIYTVSAIADPVSGGTAEISYLDDDGNEIKSSGQLRIPEGKNVNITAKAVVGYVFDGFIMPTETKVPGTKQSDGSYVLAINNLSRDQQIIARFIPESVAVTIVPSPVDGGTVQYNNEAAVSSETTYNFNSKTETGFTLTAKPKTGYTFQYWIDNSGKTYTKNVVRITGITTNTTFTAFFLNDKDANLKGVRVVSNPPSGGHVRKKNSGDKIKITAYPNDGWVFVGWMKDGESKFVSKSKSLKVNDEDVTYIGCFEKKSGYKPVTDIASQHFYKEKRKMTEPSYSVSRQTIENLAATAVSYDQIRYSGNLPALHSYNAVTTARNYYNDKLSSGDADMAQGILITTENEVIGTKDVKDIAPLMSSANAITLSKFGERYDSEIVAAVYTEPPEGFDGSVRTYLWKQTGANVQDNMYVMYRDKGTSFSEMAAVVNEDGAVRFTLEDALVGTEFALVRVTISDNSSDW